MANASFNEEETINASLGKENTIKSSLPSINYIPGYKEAEEQRRKNEEVRISNETEREEYFENMKEEYESGALNGATFIPNVDIEGNISWTNDKGLVNPTTRNVKGPKGDTGDKGDKGDKGDAGAIKFLIVQSLPTIGSDDTIYLVEITPDASGNNYAEYIYVNESWELLGKIGVQVDLTDYVKSTDYATPSVGGVIKVSNGDYGMTVDEGVLKGAVRAFTQYNSMSSKGLVCKGTLENVITGKDLTTKSYVDGLVGNIASIIDEINGESVGD